MEEITLTNQDKLSLQNLAVDAVVLFGSRATGDAGINSDYDFGVLLGKKGYTKRRENYHQYYTAVYDIFAERFGDLKGLDIVFLDQAPLEMRRHILYHGKALMETSAGQLADYNAQSILLYADFEPYRRMMNKAVLDRI